MNTTIPADQQALIHDNLELLCNFSTENIQRLHDSEWNYNESGNDWYSVCTQGPMQSPILIDYTNIIKLGVIGGSYYPFKFNYLPTDSFGEFVDKTYRVLYLNGTADFLSTDGNLKTFKTTKIEIHAPAEHIIKGKQRALELHIFHKDMTNGNYMVLAVLFKISPYHNSFIQGLIDNSYIDVGSMIGQKPEVFVYPGSLTYPPCTETVLWVVSAETQKMSYEQVKFFSSKWENNQAFAVGLGNYRATQPVNARVVFSFS